MKLRPCTGKDASSAKRRIPRIGGNPAVRVRVADLSGPPNNREHVAVQIALSRHVDRFWNSAEIAHSCICYLKERMAAPVMFLPMPQLKANPIEPWLQRLMYATRSNAFIVRILLKPQMQKRMNVRADGLFLFLIGHTFRRP